MVTGDPICNICGRYVAWCGGCIFASKQYFSILELKNSFNFLPAPTAIFLESQIKFLEEEIRYLKERVEMLESFHAETCEVIGGGMKCSCHMLGVK